MVFYISQEPERENHLESDCWIHMSTGDPVIDMYSCHDVTQPPGQILTTKQNVLKKKVDKDSVNIHSEQKIKKQ